MNFTGRRSKVTALVLLLLVALASIGIAYAHWTKILDIDGTVGTGDLNLEFVPGYVYSNDEGTAIDPGKDKHVGVAHCEVNQSDSQIVDVTVENGYPSYQWACSLKWENTGTIPAKLCVIDCPTVPPELTISVQNTLGEVIDPGQQASGQIEGHVEQIALEGASYAFQCQLVQHNWNEPCP